MPRLRHSMLEMRVVATEKLTGVVQNLSAVAVSVLPVTNDGSNFWYAETRNPAWIALDILTSEKNPKPLARSQIDWPSWLHLVAVCDASPHGLTRLFTWAVEARALATDTPLVVVVNRAPDERYQRAELYDEIRDTLPVRDVAFVAFDPKVARAAWHGELVAPGRFTRAVDALAERIESC